MLFFKRNLIIFCLMLTVLEANPLRSRCAELAQSSELFNHFRQDPAILELIDTLTYEEGEQERLWLAEHFKNLLECATNVLENDNVGSPTVYLYNEKFFIAPSNWRLLKIVSDLQTQFKDISQYHILDIGGGYGGLCRLLKSLGFCKNYTIIDYPENNALTGKYLDASSIDDVQLIDLTKIDPSFFSQTFDLIICQSKEATEKLLSNPELNEYLLKIIPCGYCIQQDNSQTIHSWIRALTSAKKKGIVRPEHPAHEKVNCVMSWQSTHLKKTPLHPYYSRPSLVPGALLQTASGVTYEFTGGRLGDNLFAYLHAKWLSYQYGLPLLYKPFPYSDQFVMDTEEPYLEEAFQFQNQIALWNSEKHLLNSEASSTLWQLPPYPECFYEYIDPLYQATSINYSYFFVDWEDPVFLEEIKSCLMPKSPFKKITLSNKSLNVALHVRKGGGHPHDQPGIETHFPLKFPHESFYLKSIEDIANLYPNKKIEVYLFTDDPKPGKIAKKYAKKLNNANIHFSYRKKGNSHSSNVVEDFFALTQFDCLIRSASSFSMAAAKLADYEIEIGPAHYVWKDGLGHIDQVEIRFCGK